MKRFGEFILEQKKYTLAGVTKGKWWVLGYMPGVGYIRSNKLKDAHMMSKKAAVDMADGETFTIFDIDSLRRAWRD